MNVLVLAGFSIPEELLTTRYKGVIIKEKGRGGKEVMRCNIYSMAIAKFSVNIIV